MVTFYFLPDFNYEVIHYHHDTHINITCTGNSFPAYNFHPSSQSHITGIYFQTHDMCVITLFRLPNHNRKSNFCELNKSIIKINIEYFIVKRRMQF